MKNFKAKVNNYCFQIDNSLIQIGNYKDKIDANTESIEDLRKHSEETIRSIRETVENEVTHNLKTFGRLDDKIEEAQRTLDGLPSKLRMCESNLKLMQGTVDRLNETNKRILVRTTSLESGKCDQAAFKEFKTETEQHMRNLDVEVAENTDNAKQMESWIDIYLPVRVQH